MSLDRELHFEQLLLLEGVVVLNRTGGIGATGWCLFWDSVVVIQRYHDQIGEQFLSLWVSFSRGVS